MFNPCCYSFYEYITVTYDTGLQTLSEDQLRLIPWTLGTLSLCILGPDWPILYSHWSIALQVLGTQ